MHGLCDVMRFNRRFFFSLLNHVKALTLATRKEFFKRPNYTGKGLPKKFSTAKYVSALAKRVSVSAFCRITFGIINCW